MSHFYGALKGNRGEAIRLGTIKSGMHTTCASWQGAVTCRAYVDADERDCVAIYFTRWHGAGSDTLIYKGPIDGIDFTKSKGQSA